MKSKEWSPARRKAFIVSVLRSGTRRWPPKYETLNDAKTTKHINPKTKRLAQHYRCAACLKEFTATAVEVDHIRPVVNPAKGFTSWDDFIDGLFCDKSNLQVLCKPCHVKKSKEERCQKEE